MKRQLFSILSMLLLLLSCVHELPSGNPLVVLTLHLQVDDTLTDYTTVTWPPVKSEGAGNVHYTVRLYRAMGNGYEHTPAYTYTFQTSRSDGLDQDVTLNVAPQQYLVLVWAQYGSYYNTDSFDCISLFGEYSGANWERDAFSGSQEISLQDIHTVDASHEAVVQLSRPLAQYRCVATDKEEFLRFWSKEYSIRHGIPVKSDFQIEDLSTFRVRVVYPQYLPSAFNLFSDRPTDSITAVSYWYNISLMPDGSLDLGFDWVMVAPDAGAVVVTLEFYDAAGEYISSVQNIEIPLHRGQITTVKGKLLTSGINSGIAIDPTFDGEYTIYL